MKFSKTLIGCILMTLLAISLVLGVNLTGEHTRLINQQGDASVLEQVILHVAYRSKDLVNSHVEVETYYPDRAYFRPLTNMFGFESMPQADFKSMHLLERAKGQRNRFDFSDDLSLTWEVKYTPTDNYLSYSIHQGNHEIKGPQTISYGNENEVISGAYMDKKIYLLITNHQVEKGNFRMVVINAENGQIQTDKPLDLTIDATNIHRGDIVKGFHESFFVYGVSSSSNSSYNLEDKAVLYRIDPLTSQITQIDLDEVSKQNLAKFQTYFVVDQQLYTVKQDGLYLLDEATHHFERTNMLSGKAYQSAQYKQGKLYLIEQVGKQFELSVYHFADLKELYHATIQTPYPDGQNFVNLWNNE